MIIVQTINSKYVFTGEKALDFKNKYNSNDYLTSTNGIIDMVDCIIFIDHIMSVKEVREVKP